MLKPKEGRGEGRRGERCESRRGGEQKGRDEFKRVGGKVKIVTFYTKKRVKKTKTKKKIIIVT